MTKYTLKVRMMGDFALEYEGKEFAIERNNSTKVNQLFQILLFEKKGIARVDILSDLFDDELISNPSNSLRALVFRLRKALDSAGLPGDEYVHISKGVYSFSPNFEIVCDAHDFEEQVNALELVSTDNERLERLIEICDIYNGDFLPMTTGSTWRTCVAVRLKKSYLKAVKQLCELFIAKKRYKEALDVAKKAVELYPYDGIQIYLMQAMIQLGKYQDAMRLYDETEKIMFNELGISAPEPMKKMLEALGEKFTYSSDVMENVQKNLETIRQDEDGAFYCNFPSFTENYRYVKRVIKRSGQSAWLMLCTITDGKGMPLSESDRLENLSTDLYESINDTIRGGDMFTRYSDNQYIVLLLGITKEDCSVVEERILSNMEKDGRKRYFKFQLAPVNETATSSSDDEISAIVRGME